MSLYGKRGYGRRRYGMFDHIETNATVAALGVINAWPTIRRFFNVTIVGDVDGYAFLKKKWEQVPPSNTEKWEGGCCG
jgi:hypothetical protein